jgi:hypothetical protein
MKKWRIYVEGEWREFWARTGDDCYLAIRSESKYCVVGYQLDSKE